MCKPMEFSDLEDKAAKMSAWLMNVADCLETGRISETLPDLSHNQCYFVEASELFLAPTFSRIEPAGLKIELTQAADADHGLALSWLYPPDQY